jgi:hypothetical protein
MTDDIDILARVAYETGIDPIHYATEHVIRSNIVVWLADCGGGGPDLLAEVLPLRILGDLLAAGWKAPEVTP